MSNDINILENVNRIINDNCNENCPDRSWLCANGICKKVVLDIGVFFLHCAEKQYKEENEGEL